MGQQKDRFSDGKTEMKSCSAALLKLSEEADPWSRGVGLDYLHGSLPVSTTLGFCVPNPMMEHTHTQTSRAPSTNLKAASPAHTVPATPGCLRGTLNYQTLWGAGASDMMENIASERRFFFYLHQKPEQQVHRIIMVPTQWSREGPPVHYKEIICPVTMALHFYSAFFFPQEITMCFTSLSYCSHKWNPFRTLKCSHLGLSLQFHSAGGEGARFWGWSMKQDNIEPQL